jgi:hypothetical protein
MPEPTFGHQPEHVVMFSGGLGSWRAAKIAAREHGTDRMVLLFADTLMEDPDLYRFIREAAADIGAPLVTVTEGRTPWEVFRDVRYLGNTRVDPCSRVLKREPLRKWLVENTDPEACTIYLGIGWDEAHRFENAPRNHAPWKVRAPLCEDVRIPLGRDAARAELAAAGIAMPALYEHGFSHNNCGGFCVKAGQASFKLLLDRKPDEYARHEAEEEALRQHLGKDVAVMRDRSGGEATPLTMRAFRERIQGGAQMSMFDAYDHGACSCLGAA